ncbi:MAG: tRNA (5-methylaminomethyl-2-thiouridine)(34)-methyltransferase MnmD [Bacteroidales bacterium]|nr:tRNA (5-methylaminomethyl-2-thiouridine)(34)-methyltransferase MnmD [Bacteroidales bacterium]
MKTDLPAILITEDGSSTVFSQQTGEYYHSVHGAIQESMHVFVEAGLRHIESIEEIRILEVGFGTGLNCLLSLAEIAKTKTNAAYYALDPFPLDESIAVALNYCQFPGLGEYQDNFSTMHRISEGEVAITPFFKLIRIKLRFEEACLSPDFFNLVYFDAFSAEAQPELWTPEIFGKIRTSMKAGGVLVTYAAKGSVRRALQESGFCTERLPGPPGKREMLRATAN